MMMNSESKIAIHNKIVDEKYIAKKRRWFEYKYNTKFTISC
jgi:hypothetical protein